VLHTAAYRELGLTGWTYEAIECDEAGLPELLRTLGPDWAGLSLTMPLKRAVLPLLDRADPLVTDVGAANTVLLSAGSRAGYNTDVPGMNAALAAAGVRPGGPVLLLGSGATACSALVALSRAGTAAVTVAVRVASRAGQLLEVAGRCGIRVRLVAFGPGADREAWLAEQQAQAGPWRLVLSTVPGKAADEYAGLIAAGQLATDAVFDVLYHPWPTRIAAAAAAAGAIVISGFELLLHQAAGQVQLMTGAAAPVEAMRAAGLAALAG
jgi:shikimate dehydrogenase